MFRNFIQRLRFQFLRGNSAVQQLILINIAVYLLLGILRTFCWLLSSEETYGAVIREFKLYAYWNFLGLHPWSIITYMFLHEEFWHIAVNMLTLYFFGRIFSDFQPPSRVWLTYFFGGLLGGIFYIVSYNLFPVFQDSVFYANVLGASAGVMAILVAAGTLTPDYTLFIPFIGGVRLKYIVYLFIILDVMSIPKGNAGGHITHIGGAALGFLYIMLLKSGRDIYKPFLNFQNTIQNFFRKKKHTSHDTSKKKSEKEKPKDVQKELDRILDKISKSGYENLTKEEKEFLFRASKSS